MILVDTSIWVDHLRSGLPQLTAALQKSAVLIHPWVIGELACRLGDFQSFRASIKAGMHDITALLAMAIRPPERRTC